MSNGLPVSREAFLEWRSPRMGTANPSVMTNPVWEWLIRTRMNAYQATKDMGGPSALDAGPGWCFDRFGQSTNLLEDGREVLIAGEHEDYYDPDFFIYNDVVVKAPDGGISIYGYPADVFPPTDFHTATLWKRSIMLIGSLGYQEDRAGKSETQVLQLMLDDFAIRKFAARGASPGWINRHRAVLFEDGRSVTVSGGMIDPGSQEKSPKENIDDWVLDLENRIWTRSTNLGWPQWTFRHADKKHNMLWSLRLASWMREIQWNEHLAKELNRLEEHLGRPPDLDALPMLYRLDDSVHELPKKEHEHSVFRVVVDGLVARFTENSHEVRGIVEGNLPDARLRALQESVRGKLSALEGVAWEIEEL